MDSTNMPVEVTPLRVRPLTTKVCADETLPKVKRLEVLTHGDGAPKQLATGFFIARHGLGFLDTLSWRRLPLTAFGNMCVVVIFR